MENDLKMQYNIPAKAELVMICALTRILISFKENPPQNYR